MSDEIIIDGLEEHAFRRSIESMLRHGRADEAADRLRTLLPELSGAGRILPARMAEITADDLTFTGWDQIAAKLDEYGRAEAPITAVGIGICDPQDSGLVPDDDGNLSPPLETTYYSDATFPFSQTDREDLLEGYSSFGCEWQGDHDRADHTLSIKGIDDIYGAIAALESKVAHSEKPSAQDIRAGAIGACYLGVLVFQAARDTVMRHGLPRPLAILLVNNDAYPFFDAPVLTCDEYLDDGEVQVIDRVQAGALGGEFMEAEAIEPEQTGSLVDIGAVASKTVTRKKMALALEGDEAANPLGMADELVAEAAFNPDSVDISRFLPQPLFRRDMDGGPSDEEPPFEEIEYPVETILPEFEEYEPEELEPETVEPDTIEPDTVEPAGQADQFPDTAWSERALPEEEIGGYEEPEAFTAPPLTGNFNGPQYDDGLELSDLEADSRPRQQPAGHALRSRMRIAPPEEEVPSALDKLSATFARIFKRVQELLLRR